MQFLTSKTHFPPRGKYSHIFIHMNCFCHLNAQIWLSMCFSSFAHFILHLFWHLIFQKKNRRPSNFITSVACFLLSTSSFSSSFVMLILFLPSVVYRIFFLIWFMLSSSCDCIFIHCSWDMIGPPSTA